jgi:hypothetical protein
MTLSAEEAPAVSKSIAFAAPSVQVLAILDDAEVVRVRLVLFSATIGEQRGRHLGLLAGELEALRRALRDDEHDSRLSRLGSALAMMAEVFRQPGPELAGWCKDVLEVPPRRLARHLDVLANALFPSGEPELPWGSAYEPVVLEALLVRHLECVFRSIAITDSSGRRSSNPVEGDHPIQWKAITNSGRRRSPTRVIAIITA